MIIKITREEVEAFIKSKVFEHIGVQPTNIEYFKTHSDYGNIVHDQVFPHDLFDYVEVSKWE